MFLQFFKLFGTGEAVSKGAVLLQLFEGTDGEEMMVRPSERRRRDERHSALLALDWQFAIATPALRAVVAAAAHCSRTFAVYMAEKEGVKIYFSLLHLGPRKSVFTKGSRRANVRWHRNEKRSSRSERHWILLQEIPFLPEKIPWHLDNKNIFKIMRTIIISTSLCGITSSLGRLNHVQDELFQMVIV